MSEPATTVKPEDLLHGAGVGHWVLDPDRSSVALTHKTLWNLVTVKGTFESVAGAGDVAPDGTVTGRLELAVASLTTKNAKRDKHLRSDDFFAGDSHPDIVFVVTGVTPDSGGVRVRGDLTVAGTTKPLQFGAAVASATSETVSLSAELTVDRAEFGMTWNQLGMMKGHATVTITATLTHHA
jgi:polyisoprenoid-binding protein YceI